MSDVECDDVSLVVCHRRTSRWGEGGSARNLSYGGARFSQPAAPKARSRWYTTVQPDCDERLSKPPTFCTETHNDGRSRSSLSHPRRIATPESQVFLSEHMKVIPCDFLPTPVEARRGVFRIAPSPRGSTHTQMPPNRDG